MAISFACSCGKALRAKDEAAGKRAKCPQCGAIVNIPAPEVNDEAGEYALMPEEPAPAPFSPARPPLATTPFSQSSTFTSARGGEPQRFERTTEEPPPTPPGSPWRERVYWVLILAFIPLAASMAFKQDDVKMRVVRTLQKNEGAAKALVSDQGISMDDLLAALPEGKIEGAHLAYNTWVHWVYATIAAAGFFGLLMLMFPPGTVKPWHLLGVGLFTGTIGIVFLLGVQFVADMTQGVWLRGRGIVLLLFYIIKFIGFSYNAALDPDNGFLLSFLGFTCGVGLCEEICKAVPVLSQFIGRSGLSWRGACLWGLASGVGFGISEGIMYSSNHYNGISPASAYVIRFISCVGLHAIWSASVGITAYRCRDMIQEAGDLGAWGLVLVRVAAVPMVLHGLYDTLLKKDLNVWALAVGLVSFAWLAWQIETARGEEPTRERAWASA